MSQDIIPSFEILLAISEVNKIIIALIKDQAFTDEFIASCIAHYYKTILEENKD